MKRVARSEPVPVSSQLRVRFSDAVSTETLKVLHNTGLEGDLPSDFTQLIRSAGGERISGVYELSPAEIADDRYGFAREFKLYLRAGSEVDQAVELLKRSPLVKSVRPMLFQRPFDT